MAHTLGAIISLLNSYERFALGDALKDRGYIPFYCTNPTEAERLFRQQSFDIQVIVFDADQSLRLADSILEFIESRGYRRSPYLWGLSNRVHDGNLDYELRLRRAEFCSKDCIVDFLRKADAVAKAFATIIKPEFLLVHNISETFRGLCVAGEVFSKLNVRTPLVLAHKPILLAQTPLVFADAIFRYSSEEHPLTASALLRLMEMDPVYLSGIREESLNKRNFITNFYRIKEESIRPILGPETDNCAISEKIPGGEHVFYFRADIIVKHIKITPPTWTV